MAGVAHLPGTQACGRKRVVEPRVEKARSVGGRVLVHVIEQVAQVDGDAPTDDRVAEVGCPVVVEDVERHGHPNLDERRRVKVDRPKFGKALPTAFYARYRRYDNLEFTTLPCNRLRLLITPVSYQATR